MRPNRRHERGHVGADIRTGAMERRGAPWSRFFSVRQAGNAYSARNFGMKHDLGLPLAVLALILGFGVSSEYFLTRDTFVAIANEIPALLVMAVGMTCVLVIAGIDLSVGSVLALSAGLSAVAMQ